MQSMAETMTKNTPKSAKFSWKTLIENLAGKRERAIADYQDLIDRMAGGEEITEAAIEAALAKCGKSVFDLQSDVAAKAERVEWVAEIERLRTVVADGEQAAHDDERLVAEHNATVERMLIELDKIRSGLRPRVHAGSAAASRIFDLEHKLRSSPPAHVTEQQAVVHGKVGEALARFNRRQDEWVDIKTSADRAEREQSEGWETLVAERDLRKRLADQVAAELKELQAQADELAKQMVQP
jgi:hypothetical protein